MLGNPMSLFFGIWGILEKYGFYLLFLLVVIYNLYPKYIELQNARYNSKSLEEANDPERVSVLNIEIQKVRKKQQQQMYQESIEGMKKQSKKKTDESNSTTVSGGYNPLSGNGGSGARFTPSRAMRSSCSSGRCG